ncbi:MAG TPA: hypothetical protein VGI10_07755 [Polyangiaceae bacterium]|jgi:hypothetical protein
MADLDADDIKAMVADLIDVADIVLELQQELANAATIESVLMAVQKLRRVRTLLEAP